MRIRLTLNMDGEVDHQVIDVADDDVAEVSEQLHEALRAWVLAPGDTITIEEGGMTPQDIRNFFATQREVTREEF